MTRPLLSPRQTQVLQMIADGGGGYPKSPSTSVSSTRQPATTPAWPGARTNAQAVDAAWRAGILTADTAPAVTR